MDEPVVVSRDLFLCLRCKRVMPKKEGKMTDRHGRMCKRCVFDPDWLKRIKKRPVIRPRPKPEPPKRLTREEWIEKVKDERVDNKILELKEKGKIIL